jgi:hypothetical protein
MQHTTNHLVTPHAKSGTRWTVPVSDLILMGLRQPRRAAFAGQERQAGLEACLAGQQHHFCRQCSRRRCSRCSSSACQPGVDPLSSNTRSELVELLPQLADHRPFCSSRHLEPPCTHMLASEHTDHTLTHRGRYCCTTGCRSILARSGRLAHRACIQQLLLTSGSNSVFRAKAPDSLSQSAMPSLPKRCQT